jgi:hypothetical protein
MPVMIDYAVLCRAIDDWKAGHAPRVTAPPSSPSAETVIDGGYEPVEEEVAEAAEDVAEEAAEPTQTPEDRTMIYHMPEIVDEGEEI